MGGVDVGVERIEASAGRFDLVGHPLDGRRSGAQAIVFRVLEQRDGLVGGDRAGVGERFVCLHAAMLKAAAFAALSSAYLEGDGKTPPSHRSGSTACCSR
ncbi:MAG TPA: hypothetical protein VEX15_15600 [Nocardioidaceae bacterium]|nr:hypothetical protein [Nocardioidaceae bacterium]